MPPGFSWVDGRKLAALAWPDSSDDLQWLREQGIDLLISLTEDPPFRRYVNEAGLFALHVPIPDFSPPTFQQLDTILGAIAKAHQQGLAAAVHCAAGKGRTGTVLAAYFVQQGKTPAQAIQHVRDLRPGSIETGEQEECIRDYAKAKSS